MTYPAPPPPPWSGYAPTTPTTPTERTWAMGAHLGALVSAWFALGLIAPLAVLLFMGGESPFVRRHATESLNFQISLLIYSTVAVVLAIVTLGIGLLVIVPVAIVVGLLALVAIIMAGLAANRGDDFRYPLCLRIIG